MRFDFFKTIRIPELQPVGIEIVALVDVVQRVSRLHMRRRIHVI
jgi:hypothetical protein